MALTMEKKSIEAERTAALAQSQVPLRAESAPTGVREAAEVLWEDARLYISDCAARDGSALVEGTLYCQALYRLEGDSALRTAEAEVPIQEPLEAVGAKKGMWARCEGEIEHLEAEYAGGRVVFSAVVDLRVRVLETVQAQLVLSASGEGLFTRQDALSARKKTAEAGAAASLRDEVALPPALRARGVLVSRCAVKNLVCEREPGGARVGGEIQVEALIRCGVEERPVAMVKYALPFQQALSFPDGAGGEAVAFVQVKRLSCQLDDADPEETALKIACEADVKAALYETREISAVTDAFETGSNDVQLTKTRLEVTGGLQLISGREDFRGELLLGDGGLSVGAVLAVRAQPYVSETDGDRVRGVVEAVCLYVPAGREQVACARGEMPFEMRVERPVPENARVRVETSDADAMSVVSDRLEVRCQLLARCECPREDALEAVADMVEIPASRPNAALIIRYADSGDDLWSLARRFRVPPEEIARLNPGLETPKAGEPVLLWV